MNYSDYRKEMAENTDFWKLEGTNKIIEFLRSRHLNYLIYRLGEGIASDINARDRPVVTIELHPTENRAKVSRYFATYQLFTMHLEKI
jgi:hypothetical protein